MVAVFRAPASTQHGDAYRPVRFVIAGLLNTLFGFVIFSAAIAARVPVWAALLAGLLVGIAFNFVTTGGTCFAICRAGASRDSWPATCVSMPLT